jgi:DNA-binding response OmpR family regulator
VEAKQHQIVICDDDLLIVNVVALSLELAGYAVTKAYDGAEALALMTSKPHFYDLIVVDHVMPNLDGLGLVNGLRRLNFAGKILVLSGHLDGQIQREYKKLAVDRIMAKPYDMKALLDSVSVLLGR